MLRTVRLNTWNTSLTSSMPAPFYPFEPGDPEPLDSLEPADSLLDGREENGAAPETANVSDRSDAIDDGEEEDPDFQDEGLVLSSDFSSPGYDEMLVESAWENGDRINGNDPALWRKDQFGAWICRSQYGRRHSEFGWEICDLSAGRGNGGLAALRPMQWQNYLDQVAALTRSRMTADGGRNVRRLV